MSNWDLIKSELDFLALEDPPLNKVALAEARVVLEKLYSEKDHFLPFISSDDRGGIKVSWYNFWKNLVARFGLNAGLYYVDTSSSGNAILTEDNLRSKLEWLEKTEVVTSN